MQNYHIYESIGRGKHSTVYKGRKKKTITYYAIKSVEKNQRAKVLQEVRTMHALEHDNILKFYAWYETHNHLWLVLEYCVGGDLLTILRQDVRLPEEAVRDFAVDLVTALSFLHSRGLVYCDLKPSNILLDENGHLKLGDFGLTRRVTGDVRSDGAVAALPPAKRGTPVYMAPELFQPDGCHSACSDLYALGCCLYECLAGRPPFVSTSFTELVNMILFEPPPALPPSTSTALNDLIMGLLAKDPMERLQWDQVLEHPFWADTGAWPAELCPPGGGPGGVLGNGAKNRLRESVLRSGSVDVMRLSQIARTNRAKESEEYRHGAGGEGGQGESQTDVHLADADAELDFAEEAEDAGPEATTAGVGAGELVGGAGAALAEHLAEELGDSEADAGDGDVVGAEDAAPVDRNMRVSLAALPTPARPDRHNQDLGPPAQLPPGVLPPGAPAATPPGVGQPRRGAAAIDNRAAKAAPPGDVLPLADLLWHASDVAVKPIVLNRRIDKVPEPRFDARTLPFQPWALGDMLAAPQNELEAFLTHIYKSVAQSASLNEKVNTLGYFETLCMDTSAANMLINSSLMLLFVRMMRTSKAPALRIRLASVIGLLVRHATYITDELSKSGLVTALADALRDRNERLRRRAMAALGELLFYIATQQEEGARNADNEPTQWEVPASTVGLVTRLLRQGEDEVTMHYAVKAIENIVTHGGDWASRFTSQDVVINLATIYSTTRVENLRPTAASALARLLRHSPAFVQVVVDRFGSRILVAGLSDTSAKVQQPVLNILNLSLGELNARSRAALTEEASLVPALTALLEKAPSVVRAKALLTFAMLCKLHHRWLAAVCDTHVLALVDRLQKDKEPYVTHCVATFQQSVVALVPTITDQISVDVEQLTSRGGKRVQSAGSTRTGTPGGPPGTPGGTPTAALLPVLLHLLTAAPFRGRVVDAALLASVSRLLSAAEGGARGGQAASAELRPQVLQVVEALSQHAADMLGQVDAVLKHLLPTLAQLLTTSVSGDCRFLCLKLMCDILLLMISEPGLYDPAGPEGQRAGSATQRLDALVRTALLPVCPSLLDDEDPIPLYTLKLLVALLEAHPALVLEACRLGLAPRFFAFLSLEHTNNNVHNVRLCRMVVAADGAVPDATLREHRVAEKVAAVLTYAFENSVEPFMEPVLDICRLLLRRTVDAVRRGESEEVIGAAVLVDTAPIFVEAAAAPDLVMARVAYDCVAALRTAYGPETARALLTPGGVGGFITAAEAFEEDTRAGSADAALHTAVLNTLSDCCAQAPGPLNFPSEAAALVASLQRLQVCCGSEVGTSVTRALAALKPLC